MYLPFDINLRFARSYWWSVGFICAAYVIFELSDTPVVSKFLRLFLSYSAAVWAQTLIGFSGVFVGATGVYAFVQWIRAYTQKQRADRQKMMRQAAEQLKYQFAEQAPPELEPFVQTFVDVRSRSLPLHTEPAGAKVSNFILTRSGSEIIAVFDYEANYRSTVGEQQTTTFYETVYLIASNRLALPYFQTQPESVAHLGIINSLFRLTSEGADLDFPSHPNFSERYTLDADDAQRVRQIFTPAVLNFYEQNQFHRTGGGGKTVFIADWRDTTPINGNQIAARLNTLHQFYQLLKSNSAPE